MNTFSIDNTEGYTTAQLVELNRRWAENHADLDPDTDAGKHACERLLTAFDTETATYRIVANGIEMGTYTADSEDAALEAYARDAGYASWEAACEVAPVAPGEVVVEEAAHCRVVPADSPRDFHAAGDPQANHFPTREAAEKAIEELCALGGEWDIEWAVVEVEA